jgi:hypothetical protein
MTPEELEAALTEKVHVTASDYAYDGWLVAVFLKRRGERRCVVEDSNGRLFIHNASQLTERLSTEKK